MEVLSYVFCGTGLQLGKFLTNLAHKIVLVQLEEQRNLNLGIEQFKGYRTLIYIEPESGVQNLEILQGFLVVCHLSVSLIGKFSRGN